MTDPFMTSRPSIGAQALHWAEKRSPTQGLLYEKLDNNNG